MHRSRRPRMFRPYFMNTLEAGGPTMVINHCVLVDCFQLISFRLSHSQLDARSAAWLSLWIALFLSLPLVPTAVISLHTVWEQKPLTPTSTGNSQVSQPFFLQRSSSSVYLAFYLSEASSHLVSHGTVSSMTMSFFHVLGHSTMYCLRVVWTTSGKTSLFPKSTSMFQPVVPPRIDDPTLRFCNIGFAVDEPTLRFCNVGCAVCVFLVSPDLTKAICPC